MARLSSPVAALGSAGLGLALSLLGCQGGWYQYPLPAPESPNPLPSSPALRAGFGRADITPPPGVGLAGNGPEGRTSTGWRHRLYARALVLEDGRGERIALVVADLLNISPNLHRLAADRLVGETGIGADRLVVAGTHTHSGPGHFYADRQYNESSARLPGYDPAVADLLVTGIVRAVRDAYRSLQPARAAWGLQTVRGFTRNRSYRAYCRNPDSLITPCPNPNHPTADDLARAVDPVWSLLRVDRLEQGEFKPAGAFSVFAIHGTANPSVGTLLDGDIHSVVERRLEWLIDSSNGRPRGFTHQALHLFANGSEGDVSPNRDLATTQCPVPRLRAPAYAGPREVAAPWEWADSDRETLDRCFRAARHFIDSAGQAMGDSAFAHFRRLGDSLRSDLTIARAFTTVPLPGRDGLCPVPAVGTSTAAGASDVRTRLAGWKLFGLRGIGFEQGGTAIRRPAKGCQAEKRILLGSLQQWLFSGEHGLPAVAQLSAVRIGGVVLAAVPVEATTTVGRLFKQAVLSGVDSSGERKLRSAVLGLSNGFLQYVTTKDEYAEQTYEGGSTLYGPRTAEVLANELRLLGRAMARTAPNSPPVEVAPITAYPGKPEIIMPSAAAAPGRPLPDGLKRECGRNGRLMLTWIDEPPGRLVPAAGQVLEIDQLLGGSWLPFAWDDQPDVVVEAMGKQGSAYRWRVTVQRSTAGKTLRLKVLPRSKGDSVRFSSQQIEGCE